MRLVSLFFFIFFILNSALASESAGGEHGGGASAAEADYSGKQTQEWSEVQAKLSALKSKVEAQEALVQSLIVETGGHRGGKTSGGDAMAERIEQLKKEHQKLQTMITEYNKMNASYETRFPEKGLKESRIYRRTDPQAIRLDEAASNYEEKVQRLQGKIMRQYPRTAKVLQAKKQKKKVVASEKEHEKKPTDKKSESKPGDVTDQIILQK